MKKILTLTSLCLILAIAGCDSDPAGMPAGHGTTGSAMPGANPPGARVGSPRPGFQLRDTEDQMRDIAEWDGKVLIVNFWATWCPPCRREIPAFVDLQDTYGERGLQFVGVAIDDKDKVVDYMDTHGVNYPVLLGQLDAIEVSKQYGNRFGALPYTVIVDRSGNIAHVQQGELTHEAAEETVKKLL